MKYTIFIISVFLFASCIQEKSEAVKNILSYEKDISLEESQFNCIYKIHNHDSARYFSSFYDDYKKQIIKVYEYRLTISKGQDLEFYKNQLDLLHANRISEMDFPPVNKPTQNKLLAYLDKIAFYTQTSDSVVLASLYKVYDGNVQDPLYYLLNANDSVLGSVPSNNLHKITQIFN